MYQLTKIKGPDARNILFILGCQRSGTSLLTRIFHRDWNAKVYFEDSNLSVHTGEEKLRLKPLPVVKQLIERQRFPLIVLKPLVEAQNAVKLLDHFPNSRALWMYRHYKDVADSNLRRFGQMNGIMDLRYLAQNQIENWRVEHVPDRVKQVVLSYFSETMNPYDAAALFWYVRNSLFFDLGLDENPKVMAADYDQLINQPRQTIMRMYDFVRMPYAGDHILNMIHNSSVRKGQQVILSANIESLCEQMWIRMKHGPAFVSG
jgi:hypothetical protein